MRFKGASFKYILVPSGREGQAVSPPCGLYGELNKLPAGITSYLQNRKSIAKDKKASYRTLSKKAITHVSPFSNIISHVHDHGA